MKLGAQVKYPEGSDLRVVDTTVHIDEADLINHLVASEAPCGLGGDGASRTIRQYQLNCIDHRSRKMVVVSKNLTVHIRIPS